MEEHIIHRKHIQILTGTKFCWQHWRIRNEKLSNLQRSTNRNLTATAVLFARGHFPTDNYCQSAHACFWNKSPQFFNHVRKRVVKRETKKYENAQTLRSQTHVQWLLHYISYSIQFILLSHYQHRQSCCLQPALVNCCTVPWVHETQRKSPCVTSAFFWHTVAQTVVVASWAIPRHLICNECHSSDTFHSCSVTDSLLWQCQLRNVFIQL